MQCWTCKSGLKIFVRVPEVPFFWATFAKSAHFDVPRNSILGAGTKILRPLLYYKSPTSPKNDGIAFGFKPFPLLGGF